MCMCKPLSSEQLIVTYLYIRKHVTRWSTTRESPLRMHAKGALAAVSGPAGSGGPLVSNHSSTGS